MKTSIRISTVAALLLAASRAAAHGAAEGGMLPHAHPHASHGILTQALAVLGIAGAAALIARAVAKRR
jgi:hypothetical protein